MQLTNEQLRALANAEQIYAEWLSVLAALSNLPGGMYWRVIRSREYLYEYAPGQARQRTKSLGPKNPESEAVYEEFQDKKQDLANRKTGIENRLKELAPVWRALNLPAIDETAGKILRAFDQDGYLGRNVLLIGTYALKVYEVNASFTFLAEFDSTDDIDFTLITAAVDADPDLPRRLLLTLKSADSSFIVSTSSSKTAVNDRAYRVDLLLSHAAAAGMTSARPWKPKALDGQEWLLLGVPVRAVLIDYQGRPVAATSPDPRYFALHKLWLSKQKSRTPGKAMKDRYQGQALLSAVQSHMPHYPMDQAFLGALPRELRTQMPEASDRKPAAARRI